MSKTIRLPDDLMQDAKIHGIANNRTVPAQIAWWARIGKAMEANPDLTFGFVGDAFIACAELDSAELNSEERKKYERRKIFGNHE